MTQIRAHTDLLLKLEGESVASSSSPMAQYPPMGRMRTAYRVPWYSFVKIAGPIPTENSCTSIWFSFARVKCPSSWKKMIKLKIKIAMIIPKCYLLPSLLFIYS